MTSFGLAAAAVLVLCAAACYTDVTTRRIPNSLTFGAAAVALVFHLVTGGPTALLSSAGGWLLGVALFAPFFILGGMGAGDVKLLAAIGAWLGPEAVAWTALYASLAGGALAIVVAVSAGYLRQALTNLWVLVGYWRVAGFKSFPELTLRSSSSPRLAYAIPVSAGAMITLWLR
jgi:prepilin peptidase CpaA